MGFLGMALAKLQRMNLKALSLLVVGTFFIPAHAQFEQLTVKRQLDAEGRPQICFKEFPKPEVKCISVQPWTGAPVQSPDPEIKITELKLTEFSLSRSKPGSPIELAAVIQWQGRGSGILSISGPKGEIFALGEISPQTGGVDLRITQFSDQSLSQQFDRSVLFGESDVFRLHAKTQIWLEEVLKPAIEEFLKNPADPMVAPR